MKQIKAVIFDMDGVLIDSEPFYYEIAQELYNDLKLKIPPEEYKTFLGLSMTEMWRWIKKNHDLKQTTEELIALNNELNFQFFRSNSDLQPMRNVVEFLEFLKQSEIKLAVASSSPKKLVKLILKKINIEHFFSEIISGNDVSKSKPAPDIFLLTSGRMKIQPANCLVVEDSTNGILAAKKAGMECFAIYKNSSESQDISAADYSAENFISMKHQLISNYRISNKIIY